MGAELIQKAGIYLKLPQVAIATAQVIFQRFFYAKSFISCDMQTAAKASIWLASKIEEDVRRPRDVINVFHFLQQQRRVDNAQIKKIDIYIYFFSEKRQITENCYISLADSDLMFIFNC